MVAVASAMIIFIIIRDDDIKRYIITMISNLIEISLTEIVVLSQFETQRTELKPFESSFHEREKKKHWVIIMFVWIITAGPM